MRRARKARTTARWLLQLGLPLLAGLGLFTGVLYSGRFFGDRLRDQGALGVAFADVECDPPEGLSRQEFLAEAQYLAELPDRLEVLQGETPSRIAKALALHPWVAKVKQVKLTSPGRVQAELVYREPTLAVEAPPRAVDGAGVLLPRGARTKGLPLLATKVSAPAARPGQPWGDVRVQAASQVVGLLRPRLDALGLAGCRVAVSEGEVTLDAAKCRLVWGRPPGQEKAGEATAAAKLSRLPEPGGRR
ncbi:MAG: hypothetical protein U0797_16980 [Gemmataceae bacterium]